MSFFHVVRPFDHGKMRVMHHVGAIARCGQKQKCGQHGKGLWNKWNFSANTIAIVDVFVPKEPDQGPLFSWLDC